MITEAFSIVLTALVTSAVSTVSWRIKEAKRDRDRDEKDRHILRSLVRHAIVTMHGTIFPTGSVTFAERQTIIGLMENYRILGGNGATEALFEDIDELPVVKDK